MTKQIGIITSCESERHLTDMIYKYLSRYNIKATYILIEQNNIIKSYEKCNSYLNTTNFDFILSVADRPEQIGAVLAAFQRKIPIGHLYAGDYNTVATFDDIHRHTISLYSDIQFCSCIESVNNVTKLMRGAGLVPNANYVGATHFDKISINNIKDYGLIPVKPYVLILINSETKGNDRHVIEDAITQYLIQCTNNKLNVIIAKGNNDKETIETEIFCEIGRRINADIQIVRENRFDHEFFLSLIKNSHAFITNSSSVIYEAPMLLEKDQIIHIGNRNKGRTRIPKESHDGLASCRTALYIKTFLETQK